MDPERLATLISHTNISPPNDPAAVQELLALRSQEPLFRRRTPPNYHHGMSTEETAQYIQEYREWFEKDRKIPPEAVLPIDRDVLIAEQLRRCFELENAARRRGSRSDVQVFLSMVGFAKHCSTISLDNLKPITFSEMLVRRVHNGRYLLCRIVAPCSRMVAIQTLVEDMDGVVHDLSIYNFPSTFSCTPDQIDFLFPVGGVLAIREPTFKAPMQGNLPLVRVDSPTDITFVVPNSALLRTVVWKTGSTIPRAPILPATTEVWQQRGNDYFKASQWFLAAFAYSHGLALTPDAAVLMSNRAEAYLRLGYYSGAMHDAQRVLSAEGIPDAHVGKAIFRLAKAQYGRGEYDAAEKNFIRWKQRHADDSAADVWVNRCHARRKEHMTGHYDWTSLFRIAEQKFRLDVADYTGPIKVSQMSGRGGGRGVITTKDVQAGGLLLVAKPFVSVYATDLPEDRMIMTLDLISNTAKERTDSVLLARVVEKLYGNPDLRDQVYHLYAGPEYPPPPDAYPPAASDAIAVEPLEPKINIDIAHLEAICTYNNFCPFRLEDHRPNEIAQPTGLYPLASLFNHSCAGKAIWFCIGDVMIVRAVEPISAGEEVTIPYSVEESYIDRQTVLKRHMVDQCTCWLCKEDRKDGDERLRRRHELKAQISAGNIMSASLTEVRKFERDVRDTFASIRGPVRPLSALALHVVAEKLRASGNPQLLREALKEDMNALRCFGFEVGQGGTTRLPIGTERFPSVTTFIEPATIMLRIAVTYLNLCDEASAVPWMKAALWLTDTSVGGGKDLFMVIHKALLEQMNIRDFAAQVL